MATADRTIRVKFDGDVKGLATAAAAGRKTVKDFGDKAGKDFADGFERGWARNGLRAFARAAGSGLAAFGTALQGGIVQDPRIAGALAAAFIAAVAAAMPAVGSVAAGAFVTAFGAGLAGLGLVFAAQAQRVKDTWSQVAKDASATMRQIAAPLQGTLQVVAGHFYAFFAGISDELARAFEDMAPALERFSANLFDAFSRLEPVIGPVTDAFIAVLDALGPELPGIVQGIADGIIEVADSIKANPDTFAALIGWLVSLVGETLQFVAWLSRLANWFEEHPAVTRPLITALHAVLNPIESVKTAFGTLRSVVETVTRWVRRNLDRLVDFVTRMPGKIARAASNMFDGLKSAFRRAANWIIGKWNGLSFSIGGQHVSLPFGQSFDIPTITLSTPDIGYLAKGGVARAGHAYIVGERGPELLMMGNTSGYVTPNHKLPKGITIENLNIYRAADEPTRESLDAALQRTAFLVGLT